MIFLTAAGRKWTSVGQCGKRVTDLPPIEQMIENSFSIRFEKFATRFVFNNSRGEGGGRDELVAFPLFTTRVSFLNKEFRARLEFDSVRCKCDRYCLRFR